MWEAFVIFITGFALGWGSVWFIFGMKEIKEIEENNNEDYVWYN